MTVPAIILSDSVISHSIIVEMVSSCSSSHPRHFTCHSQFIYFNQILEKTQIKKVNQRSGDEINL